MKADWETPQGRAAALEGFAGQGGSRLAIAHMYHQWTDEFPSPTQVAFQSAGRLQLISWSGTDTRSVTSGVYDQLIRARAEAIRDYGHPVLLRWRWEMDRPNLAAKIHSPADYVAAWKHIRAIFAATGTRNAGFVWCPHVQGFVDSKRQGAAYYPGDDQVDWLCADAYSEEGFAGFGEQMDAFMAFARTRPRPVLVGEFGVTGDGTDAQRAAWLREVREYVKRQPQIKGLVYFSEKMARPPHYDTTLAAGSQAAAAWRELATDPHFGAPPPTAGASPPAG
ncbi:MAG TPA: glycosyl hydrolase [Pilimelia sp.]|nr:glycosyl hydrolase [Pilimelia sp.]